MKAKVIPPLSLHGSTAGPPADYPVKVAIEAMSGCLLLAACPILLVVHAVGMEVAVTRAKWHLSAVWAHAENMHRVDKRVFERSKDHLR